MGETARDGPRRRSPPLPRYGQIVASDLFALSSLRFDWFSGFGTREELVRYPTPPRESSPAFELIRRNRLELGSVALSSYVGGIYLLLIQ